jgi:hypothetical protein
LLSSEDGGLVPAKIKKVWIVGIVGKQAEGDGRTTWTATPNPIAEARKHSLTERISTIGTSWLA